VVCPGAGPSPQPPTPCPSLRPGHYTAQGRSALDGQWYDFNDSAVTRCDEPSGATADAYCLFFRLAAGGACGGGAGGSTPAEL
jgi:hypothetical protein